MAREGYKRGIEYVHLPVELLKLGIKSAHELVILALAVSFGERGLRMSNRALARLLDADPSNIQRAITRLYRKAYLRSVKDNGRRVLMATIDQTGGVNLTPAGSVSRTPRGVNVTPVGGVDMTPQQCQSDTVMVSVAPMPSRSKKLKGTKASAVPDVEASKGEVRWVVPTVEEIGGYAASVGCPDFNAGRFYDYYDAAGWRDKMGRPVTNWKQKVLAWIQREQTRASVDDSMVLTSRECTEEEAEALIAKVRVRK